MLKVYDYNDPLNVIPISIDNKKRFVTHKYGGFDQLSFELEQSNDSYKYIAEEVLVEDEKNRYIIKNIDERSTFASVTCELDLDDWKKDIIMEYRPTNSTLQNSLNLILPYGWYIAGAGAFSKRTTVEESEGQPFVAVTAYDLLEPISEAYGCVYEFDVFSKTITCINPKSFTPSGKYFTDELNLRSIGYTGNSQNFVTRLYAFGKKDEDGIPLTFESINDGKKYVEDYSYSDKIISVGWSDERYTVKEDLLQAAKDRLEEMSFPVRSYSCDAIVFDNNYWLYEVVTLVDRKHGKRVDHQIVEYKEYPDHVLDVITLSSVEARIETKVESIKREISDGLSKQQSKTQAAIQRATEMITGSKGGHFLWVYDSENKPIELLNFTDADNIDDARSVWRWNAAGLGHSNNGYGGPYTLALLADGSINAEVMRAGTLSDLSGNTTWNLESGALNSNNLTISTPNFTLNENGEIEATNAVLNGQLSSEGESVEDVVIGGTTIRIRGWMEGLLKSGRLAFLFSKDRTDYSEFASIRPAITWRIESGEPKIFPDGIEIHTGSNNDPQASEFKIIDDNYDRPFLHYMISGGDSILFIGDSTIDNPLSMLDIGSSVAARGSEFVVFGDFYVEGTKSRLVKTQQFGDRALYAYETSSPMFGDVGEGKLDNNGECVVFTDPIFSSTVSGNNNYYVFIQKYGEGDAYISHKDMNKFVVVGTPGLKFAWEIKAKQKGYDQLRLEEKKNERVRKEVDYGAVGAKYYESIIEGMIV